MALTDHSIFLNTADMKVSTVDDVIDQVFGGTTATADYFGVLPSAVSNWRREGRFPDRLHYRIAAELKRRRVRIDPALFGEAVA
jgi:hypothetical protein